ncbi:MAG: hypothetical protein QM769_03240 [Pseudoxanthomonas sp.]
MMAIVSKAVFDKEAPTAKLGAVLPMKFYRSASKHLERLESGGRLFLVTVRPPSEALWLVAVLEDLKFDGSKWQASRNRYPVTDIGALKGALKFESGKGITAAKGALGMSLQTPRALSANDVELLLQATGGPKPAKPVRPPGPVQLAAHDDKSPLPCLCVRCLPSAPETIEAQGGTYFRAQAAAQGRLLWFWVPGELKARLPAVVAAVEGRMNQDSKPLNQPKGKKAGAAAAD